MTAPARKERLPETERVQEFLIDLSDNRQSVIAPISAHGGPGLKTKIAGMTADPIAFFFQRELNFADNLAVSSAIIGVGSRVNALNRSHARSGDDWLNCHGGEKHRETSQNLSHESKVSRRQ